ncbi:MAG: sn-glycerol-1-phosphate dehydrogenase [Firmicutes bacterium]|nr:sn-glycerol-1-phosphate dehydrogenase [Bacillota bacterium]
MKITYENNQLILPEINCQCGIEHQQPDLDVYIGEGVLAGIVDYLKKRKLGKKALVVADQNTYRVAGAETMRLLAAGGLTATLCLLEREGELEPDEAALGEILLAMDPEIDFLVAVGSGSINDLTRYVAFHTGREFVSVATAASMDGYTSVIAPLLARGLKVNKTATYPQVLICDLEIIRHAPYDMVISGFGDVIGKYIAKADWILGRIINEEPYCPVAADLVSQAVEKCLQQFEGIKNRTPEGIKSLMEALILSGVSILMLGHTRPVASIEHNMAHFWEMAKLLRGEKAASHGTAVGVGTLYAVRFYSLFLEQDWNELELERIRQARPTKAAWEEGVKDAYGEKIGSLILRDNPKEYIDWPEQERRLQALVRNQRLIKEELAFLPDYETLVKVFRELGSPMTAAELGIDQETLRKSLLYAKDYRERYSVFKTVNEAGRLEEFVDRILQL